MMRTVGQAEKARLTIDNEKQDHFSLWVIDCDFQDVLLILKLETTFFRFKFL